MRLRALVAGRESQDHEITLTVFYWYVRGVVSRSSHKPRSRPSCAFMSSYIYT